MNHRYRAPPPVAFALASLAAVVVSLPGTSAAQAASDTAHADALFREGKALRDGGRTAEGCSKLAQSKDLAPGVGVSLNLADCYEKLGRTASAWYEFSNAEKLARDRGDARADVAHARAQALQGKLRRLTIAVPDSLEATEIDLDDQPLPRVAYNVALAIDPGNHVVKVVPKAGPQRTLRVQVDPEAGPLTVRADEATAASESASVDAAALTPADALFEEGKRLRDAGQIEAACSKFAQSQALAPAVGITMHLGDCYERLGRTGSAWTEFTIAEKAARERTDKREATAHARAAALESKLQRITIAVPPETSKEAALVQLDGRTVPSSMWNVAVVTDSGDHLVTFQPPGGERRTFPVHVERETSVTVSVSEPAPPPRTSDLPAPAPPVEGPATERAGSGRLWLEVGLLGGAAVAAGVGAGLLVVKNDSWSNGSADSRPYVDPVAAAASKIAFGVAGAAAATAIVLYLTTSHPKESALQLAPAPMVGGGGALLRGVF